MPLRMDAQEGNTKEIVSYLKEHEAVDNIYYPGLPENPGYEIQKKQSTGFGSVFSFELNENYDADTFCNSLKIFDLAVSLGGVESLISLSATMTQETFTVKELAKMGLKNNLLRVAIGIEDIDDLITDVEQALKASEK